MLRALALTRSGRQADALDALRHVRDVLDAELGLEPGAELRELQTAVLRQDPALAWVPPSGGPAPVTARQPPAVPPARTPTPDPATHPSRLAAGRPRRELDDLTAAFEHARAGTLDLRRTHRRAGHRQVAAVRRARPSRCGPPDGPGTVAAARPVLPGRGRPTAVALAAGAARPRYRPALHGGRRRGGGVPTWEAIRDAVLEVGAQATGAPRPRRPALGRRAVPAGPQAAGRDRRPRRRGQTAGRDDVAQPPPADRRPRRRRRGPRSSACRAGPPHRAGRTRGRRGGRGGGVATTHGRAG